MLPPVSTYVPANAGTRYNEPYPAPSAQGGGGWRPVYDGQATAPIPPAGMHYYQPLEPSYVPAPPAPNPLLEKLLTLRANRERMKNDYCELMQQLMQDPLLYAVYSELRAKATPKKQYALGYGFFINSFGLTAVVDGRGQIDYKDLLRVQPEKFTPFSEYIGDFPGKDRAALAIAGRIQTISNEITSAYETASATNSFRR